MTVTVKNVEMEGTDYSTELARHQAYMNKLNAATKSMLQVMNYEAALNHPSNYESHLTLFRSSIEELLKAHLDHFEIFQRFNS